MLVAEEGLLKPGKHQGKRQRLYRKPGFCDIVLGSQSFLCRLCFGGRQKKITSPVSSIALAKASASGDTVLLSTVVEDLLCHFLNAQLIRC